MLARLFCPGYSAQATAHPATCLPVRCPGYSAQATEHPASCLPGLLATAGFYPGYCTPCHLPACLFAGQATLPSKPCRLTACLPACWPGCPAQATLPRLLHTLPPACLPVCWPGYSAQATAHPATCLLGAQATLPRLLNTLPPPCLFAGQATLPRLMHTLPPACLPFCWQGYSAQATAHPATCLSACLLARILCPGYSAQATAHPATCLPSCLLAAQATLPRLLNTLPPACLSFCWTGYSAQATAHPATA